MNEFTADTESTWPPQQDGRLGMAVSSHVDERFHAMESELCSNADLCYPDAPFFDLYGATLDWEPLLERWYAPATQAEEIDISPYSPTTPTATGTSFTPSAGVTVY
jgi:hypothetical protein